MTRGRGADVRVIGLVMSTHVIEDIAMDVPHGVTVIIPADKAARSKDLWRAISQKCLFQIKTAGPPVGFVPGSADRKDAVAIQSRLAALESRNSSLESESKALREQLAAAQARQQGTLEAILEQLKNQPAPQVVQLSGSGGSNGSSVKSSEVVGGDAPTFIPGQIRPDGAETRIGTQEVTAESDVGSVADRLKKLRERQNQ